MSVSNTPLARHPLARLLQPQFLLICLAALLLYRWLCIIQPHMGLFFDEAYYYHWSQHPDWGYYSKPPMVAWFIALTTKLLGASEFTVKMSAALLYSGAAWFIYLLGRRLADTQVGVLAALIFIASPIVGFNSLFITTDAPLFFFWALASYLFVLCMDKNTWGLWLALGFSIGCGALSKYTYLALPLGFVCFALLSRNWSLFYSPKAWVAAGLALILLGANLFWNWQHDFISFTHTKEIAQLDGPLIKPFSFLQFLLTQCFVLGPVWVVAYLFYKWKARAEQVQTVQWSESRASLFLWATLLPILCAIGSQALLSRAFANWAGAFIIPASILVAAVLLRLSLRWLVLGLALNLGLLSLFYHWPPLLHMAGVETSKKNSPYFRVNGWRQVSEQVCPQLDLNKHYLLSNSRELLAYTGFYCHLNVDQIAFWNPGYEQRIDNHYDLINNLAFIKNAGQLQYIYIAKGPIAEDLKARFTQVTDLGAVQYKWGDGMQRTIYQYQLEGFKGYANE